MRKQLTERMRPPLDPLWRLHNSSDVFFRRAEGARKGKFKRPIGYSLHMRFQ
jgi:hypothetical protein